jgi:hypothetical protein
MDVDGVHGYRLRVAGYRLRVCGGTYATHSMQAAFPVRYHEESSIISIIILDSRTSGKF